MPPVKASGARESGLEPGLAGQLRPGAVLVEASPSTLAACGLLPARPPDPPPLEAAAPRPDPLPSDPLLPAVSKTPGPQGPRRKPPPCVPAGLP